MLMAAGRTAEQHVDCVTASPCVRGAQPGPRLRALPELRRLLGRARECAGRTTLKRDHSPISRERRHHLRGLALGLAAATCGANAHLRYPQLSRKFELHFARRLPASRDASKDS